MLLQQRTPLMVAELGSFLGRSHDVGEQDRRERPVEGRRLLGEFTDEGFDLVVGGILLRCEHRVARSGQLEQPGAWDPFRHEPRLAAARVVLIPMTDHQHRHMDRGQDVPHVGIAVDPQDGDRISRTHGTPHPSGVGAPPIRVIADVRPDIPSLPLRESQGPPFAIDACEVFLPFLVGPSPGGVGGPPAVLRRERDQRGGPLRVSRCEERAWCDTALEAEEDRALQARGIHHCADVVHPRLEGHPRLTGDDVVREPGAPPIEEDETGGGSQPPGPAG
jgi:hypothetical protein